VQHSAFLTCNFLQKVLAKNNSYKVIVSQHKIIGSQHKDNRFAVKEKGLQHKIKYRFEVKIIGSQLKKKTHSIK